MPESERLGQTERSAYEELREIAEDVRRGAESLFSSLPFQPPEAYAFQINAKIARPLNDLADFLDKHPQEGPDA